MKDEVKIRIHLAFEITYLIVEYDLQQRFLNSEESSNI